MALALSMKVNTSVTQLDLDSEPKKKVIFATFSSDINGKPGKVK